MIRTLLPARPRREAPSPPPAYHDDAELLARCRAGNERAWRELLRRYRDLLYSIPRRYGLDADDAADVFQTVSVALWKGLPELRSEKALTRWIQITARRQTERLVMKNRRLVRPETPVESPDTAPSSLESVALAEEEHRVRRALQKLGGRCAELLKLLYLEEPPCSYEEITRRIGLPHGSIGPNRGRCLEKLKETLSKVP